MELGQHIKMQRQEKGYSQEDLANRVYVSRQTISNWENGKSYPDIKSLVLLSEIFSISIDILIKGDVEIMKREIDTHEHEKFENNSKVFAVLFIAMLILPVPLVMLFKWWGMTAYVLIAGDKEIENGKVAIRKRGVGQIGEMTIDEFVEKLVKEIETKGIEEIN